MKRLICMFAVAIVVAGTARASDKSDRPGRRAVRAEARKEAHTLLVRQQRQALKALEDDCYMIKFDRVIANGRTYGRSPQTNFLIINGDEAVLQLAIGGNGAVFDRDGRNIKSLMERTYALDSRSAVALEGKVTKCVKKTNRRGVISCQMEINGHAISCTVNITMGEDGNIVRTEIVSMLQGQRTLLSGTLLPYDPYDISRARSL